MVVKVKVKKDVKVKELKEAATKVDLKIPLDDEQVEQGINVMVMLCKTRQEASKKKKLFKDDTQPILLQVQAIKIPTAERQLLRIALPHPLHRDDAGVCLITKDVKFSTKNDVEKSVQHYQKYIEDKKVKGITKIIPRRQLINTMKQFEAKGRFAQLYDSFLVDGELLGLASHIVGKRFFSSNKNLIPINMRAKDLQKEISRALSKTVLTLSGKGDTFSVPVADTSFTKEQMKENIVTVVRALSSGMFPGGFPNIRGLRIKTSRSIAIPIYISLASSDSVKVPVVKPKLPRAAVPVTDELSTQKGGRVTVYPDGEVDFERSYTQEDSDVDSEEDDDEDEEEEEVEKKPRPAKHKMDLTDSDSDDDIESAETAYLSAIQKAQAAKLGVSQNIKPSKKPVVKVQATVRTKAGNTAVKPNPQQKQQAQTKANITKSAAKVETPVKAKQQVQKQEQKTKAKKEVVKKVADKLQVGSTKKPGSQSSAELANVIVSGVDQAATSPKEKVSKKVKKLKTSNVKLQKKMEDKKLARKEKFVEAKKAKKQANKVNKSDLSSSSIVQDVISGSKQATPAADVNTTKKTVNVKSNKAAVGVPQGVTQGVSTKKPEISGSLNGKGDKRKLTDSENGAKKLKPSALPVELAINQPKANKKSKMSPPTKKTQQDVLEKLSKKKPKATAVEAKKKK